MKCAHCGAELDLSLEKNGSVFCRICHHRTKLSDGTDDLIRCPYCDAWICPWCNTGDGQGVRPGSEKGSVDRAEKRGEFESIIYRTREELDRRKKKR